MKNTVETKRAIEKAFLMGISIKGSNEYMSIEDSLQELELLSKTAGLEVVGIESQTLSRPNPATFIGSGKVIEVKMLAESLKADVILFDTELSPRNFRELEESFGNNISIYYLPIVQFILQVVKYNQLSFRYSRIIIRFVLPSLTLARQLFILTIIYLHN